VEDANFRNRKELLVRHIHNGVDLDLQFAHETMRNLFLIWKRPVNLRTRYEDKEVIFTYDGKDFRPIHEKA
jgi:stage V sporulation protein R